MTGRKMTTVSRYKYTERELDDIIRSMTILVDTREQKCDHITNYFDKAGIPWMKKALKYGDYSFFIPANEGLSIPRDMYFDNEIVVERKGSLEELSGNLSSERDRLEKELALAPGKKVLMVENATYDDLINGRYRTNYNAKSFWASIHTMWHRYNIPFFFTTKSCSGFFIRGFFTYYLKEFLK